MRSLAILVLVLAVVSGLISLVAMSRTAGSIGVRWGLRGNVLLSLAIICGMAPNAFLVSASWVRWTCMMVSLALTLASFFMVRQQMRMNRDRRRALDA